MQDAEHRNDDACNPVACVVHGVEVRMTILLAFFVLPKHPKRHYTQRHN
jgi:hypothetical protein